MFHFYISALKQCDATQTKCSNSSFFWELILSVGVVGWPKTELYLLENIHISAASDCHTDLCTICNSSQVSWVHHGCRSMIHETKEDSVSSQCVSLLLSSLTLSWLSLCILSTSADQRMRKIFRCTPQKKKKKREVYDVKVLSFHQTTVYF